MNQTPLAPGFASLGLPDHLLRAIAEVGYESPSPIQAQSIPVLLEGRDLLGQAQTGTGKTAAFALPLLARLDMKDKQTQILVLAPTRELAIQVAEACQTYARFIPQFRVVPIYGGANYSTQIKQLKSNAQVVVGTPGRVMDHIRRGTLKLDQLRALVLDEADEMLRMGFIDDVEWILEHTPSEHQTALFSATMPKEIQRVAQSYLHNPELVKIASKTTTAAAINQRYWPISGLNKLDALTRILEAEPADGVIIFVRTKISTTEVADKLTARGFLAEALNGDMAQAQREKVLDKMRKGKLDILVATDVAARGIDIARISHVINYDIPLDTEAYVHRIGRTGRAGRTGEAILFVANREQRLLKAIERATKQPLTRMTIPSEDIINAKRIDNFQQKIDEVIANEDLAFYKELLEKYQHDKDVDPLVLAAALAKMAQGEQPLVIKKNASPRKDREEWRERESSDDHERVAKKGSKKKKQQTVHTNGARPLKDFPEVEMERFRINVGYNDEVKPSHIVGAIANEADLDSCYIGHIEIFDDFSIVDLPAGMPKETLKHLRKVWVCGQQLGMQQYKPGETSLPETSVQNKERSNRKPDSRRADKRGRSEFDGDTGFKKRSGSKNRNTSDSRPQHTNKTKKKPTGKKTGGNFAQRSDDNGEQNNFRKPRKRSVKK